MSTMKNMFTAYLAIKAVNKLSVLNSLVLPGGNLGIMRSQMPQIDSKYKVEFERHLKDKGISISKKKVKTRNLRLTQMEYNKDKVWSLMEKYKKASNSNIPPIYVSKDGYVLDGSHRFIALHNNNPDGEMEVYEANTDIRELLNAANSFPGATYRNISDKKS